MVAVSFNHHNDITQQATVEGHQINHLGRKTAMTGPNSSHAVDFWMWSMLPTSVRFVIGSWFFVLLVSTHL
jgi:hypothetical protein